MSPTLTLEKIALGVFTTFFLFYMAMQMGGGDFFLPAMMLTIALLVFVFFKLNQNIWLLIPIGLVNPIALPFLPVPFRLAEVVFLLLVIYLLVVHATMRHRPFSFGPANIWVPLLILCLIVLYHQTRGGIGLRILGGEAAGARRHVMFLIAVVFYIALLSLWPKNWNLFRKIPLIYMLIVVIGAIPVMFCIYFPAIAFPTGLFAIFGNISEVINYYAGAVERIGLWGSVGIAIQLWLVSRYPMRTWFQIERLWVPCLSLVALFFSVYSGFRNQFFHFCVVTAVAAILSLRWRTIVFIFPALILASFLILGNGRWFELPLAAQRALSFLPGKWDPVAEANAKASSEFRASIKRIYLDEYAALNPWFGNGYKMAARDVTSPIDPVFVTHETVESFIRNKDYHIGWISVYDSVGLVGFAVFIWLCGAVLWWLRKNLSRVRLDNLEPVHLWVACFLVDAIIGFFTVFGALSDFMPNFMFGVGIMVVVFHQMPQAATARSPTAKTTVGVVTRPRFA